MFVVRGLAGTTMVDIAAVVGRVGERGEAVGMKSALLKSCVDVAWLATWYSMASGRPAARGRVYGADEPREVLSRYAVMMGSGARERHRSTTCEERDEDGDPEIADLLADLERQRLRAWASLGGGDSVPGGLGAVRRMERGLEEIWVCNAPELYVTLTCRRRWSKRGYVEWSRNALLQLVLAPPAERAGSARHRAQLVDHGLPCRGQRVDHPEVPAGARDHQWRVAGWAAT